MSTFLAKLSLPNNKSLEFHGPADITKQTTEAIVNAANSSLLGGGGVDGAIHRAGGPSILEECKRIVAKLAAGRLKAGQAVLTTGGRLPAKYVIHTVGPIYQSRAPHTLEQAGPSPGNASAHRSPQAETLASCYRESIRLADDHAVGSLAFPSISTGAYGYPISEAAEIAVRAVVEALSKATHVNLVRFILFAPSDCQSYVRAAENLSRHELANFAVFERES
jgi:O-acetyl-ADP-ribose deacetylase